VLAFEDPDGNALRAIQFGLASKDFV
jgi:hypothetical protein